MGFNLMIHYSDDEDDQNYKHECSYLDEWRYSMRMREKRQIFLRSYEFQLMSRKRSKKKKEKRRSVGHNIKTGLLKIKRVIWVRLNKLKLNINNHCFLPSPSRIRIRRTTFFRLHIHYDCEELALHILWGCKSAKEFGGFSFPSHRYPSFLVG